MEDEYEEENTMKDLLRTIGNVIRTLMVFSIFIIVLAVIIYQGEDVFPYTIFKALGWSGLLYGIYLLVFAVYLFWDRLSGRTSEEKEESLTEWILVSLILLLIGGVFLNICY